MPAGGAMPAEKPFAYQYILDRWADGLKVLGAGNSGGLLASGAAFQFSAHKTEIVAYIKWSASCYLAGVLLFAIAFFALTILPLGIESFVLRSRQTYKGFGQLMNAFATEKDNLKVYGAFIICSIFSFVLFLAGTIQAILIILNF